MTCPDAPVSRQPLVGAGAPRMVLRIGTPPGVDYGAVVEGRAVTLARPGERVGKELVQIGSGDVEIRCIDFAAQRRLERRYRLIWSLETQQRRGELVVHAR